MALNPKEIRGTYQERVNIIRYLLRHAPKEIMYENEQKSSSQASIELNRGMTNDELVDVITSKFPETTDELLKISTTPGHDMEKLQHNNIIPQQ